MHFFDLVSCTKRIDEELGVKALNFSGKLGIVLVGDNESSKKYIRIKQKYCSSLGIACELLELSTDLNRFVLYKAVEDFVNRQDITGCIIQLPLPKDVSSDLLDLVPVEKDLDLLSSASQKALYSNLSKNLPPVVEAFREFVRFEHLPLKDLDVAVIGKGFLVGKPIAHWLDGKCKSLTVLENYVTNEPLNYQLLVLSAGVPNLVNPKDVLGNCHVVDFGSAVLNGKIVGDLDLGNDLSHLGAVAKSPGGMGPLVVRFLISNLLNARK